ncbi:putative pyridine nucleotide-disulfide oxidoreductase [Xylogone sp. PMI_703]|nr:putative pyridine nucleotide-disulfide oxidoreductase [Xylogone sp. PMI_703]
MTIGKLLANGALLVDVLIIGAGPAGLSTATGLARQLHTAVVFDSGVYRNAKTQHMHNVLGWDHRNPGELRAAGRADISNRYATIQFQNTSIESIRKIDEKQLFQACDADGNKWYGRKVVLATGVRDIPLDIEGYSECWANGIYHCLFCDGYEDRGQETVGILALGPLANVQRALHLARMAHQLSQSVTVYTHSNDDLVAEIRNVAPESESWLRLDSRQIVRFQKGEDDKTVIVHFKDQAEMKEEGFLVYNPKTEINGPFADQLSLALTKEGDIQTSQPFYETSIPGVFAVGDCATLFKAVTPAIAMGSLAAGGLVSQLQAEPMIKTAELGFHQEL